MKKPISRTRHDASSRRAAVPTGLRRAIAAANRDPVQDVPLCRLALAAVRPKESARPLIGNRLAGLWVRGLQEASNSLLDAMVSARAGVFVSAEAVRIDRMAGDFDRQFANWILLGHDLLERGQQASGRLCFLRAGQCLRELKSRSVQDGNADSSSSLTARENLDHHMVKYVGALTAVGAYRDALDTISEIGDAEGRMRTMRKLAGVCLHAGATAMAAQIVRRLLRHARMAAMPLPAAFCLSELGVGFARAGLDAVAASIFASAEDHALRADHCSGWKALATDLARAGLVEKSLAALARIKERNRSLREYATGDIAASLVRLGKDDEAVKLMSRVSHRHAKIKGLCGLAVALSEQCRFVKAKQHVRMCISALKELSDAEAADEMSNIAWQLAPCGLVPFLAQSVRAAGDREARLFAAAFGQDGNIPARLAAAGHTSCTFLCRLARRSALGPWSEQMPAVRRALITVGDWRGLRHSLLHYPRDRWQVVDAVTAIAFAHYAQGRETVARDILRVCAAHGLRPPQVLPLCADETGIDPQ